MLNPSRELDVLIAEKILGWTEIQFIPSGHTAEIVPQGIKPNERPSPYTEYRPKHVVPNFSTDIKDAWEVIEKLGTIDSIFGDVTIERDQTLNGATWKVVIDGAEIFSETAPHAICLAALEAIG